MLISCIFYELLTFSQYTVFFFPLVYYKIYLYAPISLDECHAGFYLNGFRRAVRNGTHTKYSKLKYISTSGIDG